ncbi:MAG: TolC family protein [Planctomycetaceae bacterium]|jgi:outer membrane protein TolC|nr:TolC family protein [Planctomycetaceae bacterium]
MRFKTWIPILLVTGLFTTWAAGCRPQQPVYLTGTGDTRSYYVGDALREEVPDTYVESLPEVTGAEAPLTLSNQNPSQGTWDLTLQETIRIALENGKVLRNLGGVAFSSGGTQGNPTALLSNPYGVGTIYDPALVESDPRYGVEAALSAFDGQLDASAGWNKYDEPQNIDPSSLAALSRPTVNQSDVGTFQATISKYAATGTTFYTRLNNGYEWSNSASTQWSSDWTSYVEAGFTQALLRGRGVQFNRIAGPGAIPGYYNGVVIARITADKALIDFEMGVRKMVYDVEEAYWNLYYAYRNLQTTMSGRNAAHATWNKVHARMEAGHSQGTRQAEAQAKSQFIQYRAYTEDALNNLYKTENALRYMMGISPSDGRLIKPIDEPSIARITFDWEELKAESLNRAPEIRKQKWDVKQRELELIASRNFLLPQLDLQANYRFNGMGHDLIQSNRHNSNAYASMTSGDYANWNMGLNLTIPFGYRKELAGVRNAEMTLTRARALLQEQELEMMHNISDAQRNIDRNYILAQDHFNRRLATQEEVDSTAATYEAGKTTLDQLLDAQRRLAEAESQYFRSIVDYNVSITKLHYLKGSLLEYDGVYLSEGPWPNKAYFDATRLARQRDAGKKINYGFTRPQVFSQGPVQQFQIPRQPQAQDVSYQGETFFPESGEVIYEQQGAENIPTPAPALSYPQIPYQQQYQQTPLPISERENLSVRTAGSPQTNNTAVGTARSNPIVSRKTVQR